MQLCRQGINMQSCARIGHSAKLLCVVESETNVACAGRLIFGNLKDRSSTRMSPPPSPHNIDVGLFIVHIINEILFADPETELTLGFEMHTTHISSDENTSSVVYATPPTTTVCFRTLMLGLSPDEALPPLSNANVVCDCACPSSTV